MSDSGGTEAVRRREGFWSASTRVLPGQLSHEARCGGDRHSEAMMGGTVFPSDAKEAEGHGRDTSGRNPRKYYAKSLERCG